MFRKFLLSLILIVPSAALGATTQAQRCKIDFTAQSGYQCIQTDMTACSVTDAEVNYVLFDSSGCGLTQYNDGTTDDISWVSNGYDSGWIPPGDNTDDEGTQWTFGANNGTTSNGVCAFGPGSAYYVKVKMKIPDVSDYDIIAVGFRNDAAFTSVDDPADVNTTTPAYTDFAMINVNAGDFRTYTQDDDATATDTDVTTTAWADNETHTLLVKVSAAGAVTYFVDGTAMAGAVAFTLDQAAADIYIPLVAIAKGATASDTPPIMLNFECGLQ